MSDEQEILRQLAELPDRELVAVLRGAVTGRPALTRVAEALDQVGDTGSESVVNPDTSAPGPVSGREAAVGASAQVAGGFPVPTVPVSSPGVGAPATTGGYSDSGVPTFDSVRDKVEQRFGAAQGMDELDRQTPAGRSADEQWEAREKAARERLEQIRRSMRGDDS